MSCTGVDGTAKSEKCRCICFHLFLCQIWTNSIRVSDKSLPSKSYSRTYVKVKSAKCTLSSFKCSHYANRMASIPGVCFHVKTESIKLLLVFTDGNVNFKSTWWN